MRAVPPFFLRGAVALLATACIAGCARQPDPSITGSVADDYTVRHPIQVTQDLATLDLLPGGGPGGLTDRQVADIQQFAGEWRATGRGQMTIERPVGGSTDVQSSHAIRDVRTILAGSGVPARAVLVTRYPANGPGHLAPLRLSYPVLKAGLPHDCGQWPDDLGLGDPRSAGENGQYWNFGCAQQQNLAAMVENPEDFIRPRAETPSSAARRVTATGKYRKGEPTVTAYPEANVSTQ